MKADVFGFKARIPRRWKGRSSPLDSERGQGTTEFALTATIFLAILIALFEFGRLIWVYTAVYTASREAARYGITIGTTEGGTPHYLDCSGISGQAIHFGGIGGVTTGDVTITYDTGPSTSSLGSCGSVTAAQIQSGDRVIVQVIGHYTPAGYVPLLNIPPITITSVSRRTLIDEVIIGN